MRPVGDIGEQPFMMNTTALGGLVTTRKKSISRPTRPFLHYRILLLAGFGQRLYADPALWGINMGGVADQRSVDDLLGSGCHRFPVRPIPVWRSDAR